MFFKKKKIIYLFPLLIITASFTNSNTPKKYPRPEGVKNLLFYVQRTQNTNTIVYALNLNDKNEVNIANPINIYWINYDEDGGTEPLNYVQRKYAYGIHSEITDKEKKTFRFKFVSYDKKELYLIKSAEDDKYHVYYSFKDKLLTLDRIFIKTEGGLFWPKIKYTDVTCLDNLKNTEIVDRIVP